MEELDDFLDKSVGSDPRLLPELLYGLTKERDEIQQQLSGAVVSETNTNEWQQVVAEVRQTVSELEVVRSSCLELCCEEMDISEDGEGVKLVSSEVSDCAEDIRERVKRLREVEHLRGYLAWLKRIMELSSSIEVQLSPGGVVSEAVKHHRDLAFLSQQLESSQCSHLVHYAASCLQFWGNKLREKVTSDFSTILCEMKWPFSSSISTNSLEVWDKQKEQFSDLFSLLLKLDPHNSPGGISSVENRDKNMSDPLPFPLEQLVQPLRKRFRYHFMGERRTNCKEKPEWYFTQLLTWIRDHTHFLKMQIQPILDKSDLAHVHALVEFTRGLLQEVEAKLQHDLQDIVQDDILMAHLVDELLLFSRELTLLGYPSSLPSPLSVLLDERPFHKWTLLEKQFAIERLGEITASPSSWSPAYELAPDTDDTKVPETAESFMTIIAGITDRYRTLPNMWHQLRFVEVQKELLLDFHQDLASDGEHLNPLDPPFCAYLNASCYIAAVLKEWGEMKFFITLHYHEQDYVSSSEQSLVKRPEVETILQLRKQDPEFAELEGNIFTSVSTAFSILRESFQDKLVEFIVSGFKSGCKKYRKENWQLVESEAPQSVWQEVSPSLSSVLPLLQHQLAFLREHVAVLLFPAIFNRVTNQIDQILLLEVILPSHFGRGGANQLNFDLTTAFLPLLSQFCEELSSHQLLERTREACRLLQLLPGSAKLLQELLMGVVRGGANTPLDTYSAAVSTLNEFGVHTLEPLQAHQILSNMIVPT